MNIHCVGCQPVNLRHISRASNLGGMPVSILNILWSETDQPYYLHVNTCQNVQKVHAYEHKNE